MARRTTPKRERWPPAKTKLAALIDEAIVDAYGESEQRTAFAAPTKASTKCCWYLRLTSADTHKYTNSLLRHDDTKRNALGTSESETAPKNSRITAYNPVRY